MPNNSRALITFVQKLRDQSTYKMKNWPIVVHCSAGIGRTGTLIMIDSMMEMSLREKQLDLLQYLCVARKGRINMIEKVSQYIFAHQILCEVFGQEPIYMNYQCSTTSTMSNNGVSIEQKPISDNRGHLEMNTPRPPSTMTHEQQKTEAERKSRVKSAF